jgi:DNA-binding response OmpR family regulator
VATILVVDDERAITDFVLEALSEEGYEVTTCHDGATALSLIQAAPPDLVLLDIGLPVMTGDIVLRALRAGGFDRLAVVVATAGTNAEQYLALGATDVIKKPFTLDRLLTTVEAHTSGPLTARAA